MEQLWSKTNIIVGHGEVRKTPDRHMSEVNNTESWTEKCNNCLSSPYSRLTLSSRIKNYSSYATLPCLERGDQNRIFRSIR